MIAHSIEKDFFGEFWKLYMQYHDPVDSEEYWDGLVQDSSDLVEKYKDKEFGKLANDIVIAVLSQLERVYRGRKVAES